MHGKRIPLTMKALFLSTSLDADFSKAKND